MPFYQIGVERRNGSTAERDEAELATVPFLKKAKATGKRLPIFDKDHDGELSMQELEDAVRAFLQETAPPAAAAQDTRHTNRLKGLRSAKSQ